MDKKDLTILYQFLNKKLYSLNDGFKFHIIDNSCELKKLNNFFNDEEEQKPLLGLILIKKNNEHNRIEESLEQLSKLTLEILTEVIQKGYFCNWHSLDGNKEAFLEFKKVINSYDDTPIGFIPINKHLYY